MPHIRGSTLEILPGAWAAFRESARCEAGVFQCMFGGVPKIRDTFF